MIKALIVDSDSVFQNLLCRLLASHGIKVVGRASNAKQAALLYQATWPDVVLIDFSSENTEKMTTMQKIRQMDKLAKLIVFSIFDTDDGTSIDKSDLIDAFIVKGSSAKDIVKTIKQVAVSKHINEDMGV